MPSFATEISISPTSQMHKTGPERPQSPEVAAFIGSDFHRVGVTKDATVCSREGCIVPKKCRSGSCGGAGRLPHRGKRQYARHIMLWRFASIWVQGVAADDLDEIKDYRNDRWAVKTRVGVIAFTQLSTAQPSTGSSPPGGHYPRLRSPPARRLRCR